MRAPTGELIADAQVGEPVEGIGVLWWIGVDPAHRGGGLGRKLLSQALRFLAEHGAREAILFVDDDEPGGERDRSAANRLYETSGFVEVDRRPLSAAGSPLHGPARGHAAGRGWSSPDRARPI